VVPENTGPLADPRKYVQLAAVLRGLIQDGTVRPGDQAPTVADLAVQYGWARQTIAKAFRVLVDEGLLLFVPGLGYFVISTAGAGEGGDPREADDPREAPVVRVAELLRARRQAGEERSLAIGRQDHGLLATTP
jgi:GntR family transcriptional regulator